MDNAEQLSLTRAKKALYDHDLSAVEQHLKCKLHWSRQQAREGVAQYRDYMFLKRKYREYELPPSSNIDDVWHTHIIHTENYHSFCAKVFNDFSESYLHHTPATENGNFRYEKAFELTQDLYKQEFGLYLYNVKSKFIFGSLFINLRKFLLDKFPELAESK